MTGPLALETVVQHYAWGSRTLIPALLGLPAPTADPWAELWVGAHPGGPSRLPDGRGLHEVEPDLPFLLKLLSAAEPLSLQAHPDADQAVRGFAAEEAAGIAFDAPNRTYKDPHAKPEMLVALTPFSALVGFRDPAESSRLVRGLGCPELEGLAAALDRSHPGEALRDAFTLGMTVEPDRRARLVSTVAATAAGHASDPATDPAAALAYAWVARLALVHIADVGTLAPLLMNTAVLQPGQAVALRPRTLHAYLSGAGIEIMGSSDNVVRGGLTGQHVDVDALLDVVDFTPSPLPLVEATAAAPGVDAYDSGEPAFRLLHVTCEDEVHVPSAGPRLVLVTSGVLELDTPGGRCGLRSGQAAYVPPGAGALRVRGTGSGWVAEPGAVRA
jgi:mannose-6-phosphate isomerase